MATGPCPRSLRRLLMLQGLVGLLGPGAQALEEEGGGRGVRNGSHPEPLHPIDPAPSKGHSASTVLR